MAIILIQPKATVKLKPLAQLKILKYLRYPIHVHCHAKLTTNHSYSIPSLLKINEIQAFTEMRTVFSSQLYYDVNA